MSRDQLDAIMLVMGEAFDPAFGEAWTRRQIADALARPDTHCILGYLDSEQGEAQGFALSRKILDEEELLLLAVRPAFRRRGIAQDMLSTLTRQARARHSSRIFLEMRDGNSAVSLYQAFGFAQVGLRRGYYRSGSQGPIDALTFAMDL